MTKKIYNNIKIAINNIISNLPNINFSLDKEVAKEIKINKKWGSRDRKIFYQACFDISRNFHFIKNINLNENIVDNYLELLNENNEFIFEEIKKKYSNFDFEITYSIPKEFIEIIQKTHPIEYSNILISMHSKANIYLRINTSQVSYSTFKENINEVNIVNTEIDKLVYDEVKVCDLEAIKLKDNTSKNLEFFKKYFNQYEIQDIGSQYITNHFDISQSFNIIEACAGNGGKTIHIVDKANKLKKLVCFDINESKLKDLSNRVNRLNIDKNIVETLIFNDLNILSKENSADILFIDAPCSGSGTLKRQPDLKYKINSKYIASKVELQRNIIDNFDCVLKKDGILVYSTCSILKEENEEQIDYIISKGYKLIKSFALLPHKYEGDGFFVSSLKKI